MKTSKHLSIFVAALFGVGVLTTSCGGGEKATEETEEVEMNDDMETETMDDDAMEEDDMEMEADTADHDHDDHGGDEHPSGSEHPN